MNTPTVRKSDIERKRINAWLVKRYGDGVLNHPVFAKPYPQVEVEGLQEVTDRSIISIKSEQTFAREVAGTKRAGQFIIDGGGKQSPK